MPAIASAGRGVGNTLTSLLDPETPALSTEADACTLGACGKSGGRSGPIFGGMRIRIRIRAGKEAALLSVKRRRRSSWRGTDVRQDLPFKSVHRVHF